MKTINVFRFNIYNIVYLFILMDYLNLFDLIYIRQFTNECIILMEYMIKYYYYQFSYFLQNDEILENSIYMIQIKNELHIYQSIDCVNSLIYKTNVINITILCYIIDNVIEFIIDTITIIFKLFKFLINSIVFIYEIIYFVYYMHAYLEDINNFIIMIYRNSKIIIDTLKLFV
jgi:hypothetical protein